jgi:hypothetical protein
MPELPEPAVDFWVPVEHSGRDHSYAGPRLGNITFGEYADLAQPAQRTA